MLKPWKAQNEDDDLATLAGAILTEETIEAALEESPAASGLTAKSPVSSNAALSAPLDLAPDFIDL